MENLLAGHYQLLKPLGGGGFGQTFLAKDAHLPGNGLCVVKQLQPKVTDAVTLQTAKRLFDREAEALHYLGHHDQIPRLLAHFEQNHEFYLVQEYIEGETLSEEILPGQPLSEAVVLALLQDILSVLAFVHQQNVIHRDIKPANLIRRQRDNRIVLIDFGAVKEVGTQAEKLHGQTNLTVAIGSPGYMPVEQQSFTPQFSSDIYAVGVLCMQSLSGLCPKELPRNEETGELCCAVFREQFLIQPGLATLLDKMTRYDYHYRYANATIALQALQELIGTEPGVKTVALEPPRLPSPALTTAAMPKPAQTGQAQPDFKSEAAPEVPTRPQNLSEELRKALEQILGTEIGPIAPMIVKRALQQTLTYEALIEQLIQHLPEERRSQCQEQAYRLLQNFQKTPSTLSMPTAVTVTPATGTSATAMPGTIAGASAASIVTPEFLRCCEQELKKAIGPIAPMILQRITTQQAGLSQAQLVDILMQYLPKPEQQNALRQCLTR